MHVRRKTVVAFAALSLAICSCRGGRAADGLDRLRRLFLSPPKTARPWVYWFWLNGNITREGITLDLEAMARVGIGGALIMEVDQGVPAGPVKFASAEWRKLFRHVCKEAARLGLKINMNNDAGWCGSGGPWIPPELAMQRIVWSETVVEGPKRDAKIQLAQPPTTANYYRDVAVLAVPRPAKHATLPGYQAKSFAGPTGTLPAQAAYREPPADAVIAARAIVNVTDRLQPDGTLVWDVPAGTWLILRFGHTPTGKENHPAPASGRGLECDKLSVRALSHHFDNFIKKLIDDVGPLVGESFIATHIDSWEVGAQNWTPGLDEYFRLRHGYDLVPWLPVLSGRIVGSREQSERFLWDLRETVSELVVSHYAGQMGTLARKNRLRFTLEGYTTCPCDELRYAGRADEPMGEFWSWSKYGHAFSCTAMASAAHIYGKGIVGAEAFTASDKERWLGHPGNIKELGDWAFCEGINRFVIHRYALQPWRDRRPGMGMGPWGLHYERTQTWWEQSRKWHEYLSRCQFMLRQGQFVADICMLAPEGAPQTLAGQQAFHGPNGQPADRPGHNFDVCPAAALAQMRVRDGKLFVPAGGMSYRVLVLPKLDTMSPQLLAKLAELVEAGATVIGAPPRKSPSLSGYPQCDEQVRRLATKLFGSLQPPDQITVRRYGLGRVVWGGPLTDWYKPAQATDREPAITQANWIWYDEGDPQRAVPPQTRYFFCTFRLPHDFCVQAAKLTITADNQFTCWLNGRPVGSGNDYQRLYSFGVTALLRPGENVLAVAATNVTANPNPAALIAALELRLPDGLKKVLVTDASWLAARSEPPGWPVPERPARGQLWRPV